MTIKRKKDSCEVQWVVVEFIEPTDGDPKTNCRDLKQVVPTSWLKEMEGQQFCYWPKNKNKVHSLLEKSARFPVNEDDFELFLARTVSHPYDNKLKALKKKKNEKYITTDSDDVSKKYGRKKRAPAPNRKYTEIYEPNDKNTDSESAEYSEESEDEENPPSLPTSSKRMRKNEYIVPSTSVSLNQGEDDDDLSAPATMETKSQQEDVDIRSLLDNGETETVTSRDSSSASVEGTPTKSPSQSKDDIVEEAKSAPSSEDNTETSMNSSSSRDNATAEEMLLLDVSELIADKPLKSSTPCKTGVGIAPKPLVSPVHSQAGISGANQATNPSGTSSHPKKKDINQMLARTIVSLKHQHQEITQRVISLETRSNSQDKNKKLLYENIPIKNEEEWWSWESKLTVSADLRDGFEQFIRERGGANVDKLVFNLVDEIFKREFAAQCSFGGQQKNIKISDSETATILKRTIAGMPSVGNQYQVEQCLKRKFKSIKDKMRRINPEWKCPKRNALEKRDREA